MTHGACVPVGSGAVMGVVGGTSYPSTPPKVDHGRRAGPGNDVQRLLPNSPERSRQWGALKTPLPPTCAGEVVCVVCPIGQSRVTRGLARRRRFAKEGVTAVASAQGSAARKQPGQQSQGRRTPAQQGRKGDAPVTLVGADESTGMDAPGTARQKGSRSRRPQRNAPKSVPGSADAAPARERGTRVPANGGESAPEDRAALAQDGAGGDGTDSPEASGPTGVDEDSGLEEADMDVVVTLEGVDLEAVDLDDFAVDVDVDLEVDVDIEEGPDDIDVAEIDDSLAEIEAEDTDEEAAASPEAAAAGEEPVAAAAAGPAAPAEGPAVPARTGEEGDDETFVYGDDDDDLPAAQVASAGATADPVKDYLKQIGKVPLLNAE